MNLLVKKTTSLAKRVVQTLDSFAGTKISGNYGGYLFDKFKYKNLNKNLRSGAVFNNGSCRGKCDNNAFVTLNYISEKADDLLSREDVNEDLSRSSLKEKIRAKQVLYDLENHIPGLFDIIPSEARNEAERFFGCKFSVREASLVRTFHVESVIAEKYETIADRYHLDINSEILLNMFIAIETITTDDGPFHFYNKDISRKLIKNHYRKRDTNIEKFERLEPPEKFIAEKGDWFFFDGAHVFHRASIPSKGHTRTVVQMLLEPIL